MSKNNVAPIANILNGKAIAAQGSNSAVNVIFQYKIVGATRAKNPATTIPTDTTVNTGESFLLKAVST